VQGACLIPGDVLTAVGQRDGLGEGRSRLHVRRPRRRLAVRHRDAATAAGAAGRAVGQHPHGVDGARGLEALTQVLRRRGPRQGAHTTVHAACARGQGAHRRAGSQASPDRRRRGYGTEVSDRRREAHGQETRWRASAACLWQTADAQREGHRWTAACWALPVRHRHPCAAVPRRRGVGREARGWGVAVPRGRRVGGGGLGGAKAPSCSNAWSARTPTL